MKLKKVVHIGDIQQDWGARRDMAVFCKIEITDDGRLSISGVEGPLPSGNCRGSCGQIDMHLRDRQADIRLAPSWTRPMLARFFEAWKAWHLNDMVPGCEHQTGPAWTARDVTLYHFTLTDAALAAKKAAETAALDALRAGIVFAPDPAQNQMACLPYSLTSHLPDAPAFYEPAKNTTYSRAQETKSTGWLNESEHPDGFLSKACPVCGYKYGTKHLKRELPADVVAFLASLPDTDKTPAWV